MTEIKECDRYYYRFLKFHDTKEHKKQKIPRYPLFPKRFTGSKQWSEC